MRWLARIDRKVPPGLRTLLGVVLVIGGIFGMLPVLGFWMIPLGLMVMALDIRAILRAVRQRRGR
ncbi:hypothetical protein DDZ14_10485 [Maritimibacter sp. 55A14]|uniref:hypothetical protein n=1 Tax=Maritimibacter sp. 55A14 TaxID=2174844 RepID=UPI000D61F367|nr:hypothetical protein [Maritimibacter sp. 55A14]PWE32480.1 hypothetical protein DDZ14_10485 [Maritimibacter sp. 55A14]